MPLCIARRGRLVIYMIAAAAIVPLASGNAQTTKLNGGYYLLHTLADDESDVSMLMMVKHAPPEIVKFADDITNVAKKNMATLDQFRDRDPAIRFDQNPLPAIEQNVRDSIKADKQHELLFGTSNSEFVRNFLVSQIEASSYAVHLNKVLGDQETDPARARALQNLSNDWAIARARAYRLLRNY